MTEVATMAAVFVAGSLLGFFFFGGLLWTVQRGLVAKHPGSWFMASWLVRVGVVVAAFYVLADGRWERLVVCVSGFLISRVVTTRFARTAGTAGAATEETRRAP